ncbi:hypothetical protein XENTR_v10008984 [Xenopus tropicalis]|nr:hypothetical protein XENTR_v10008984 [Xenopus tropicalis]KAE8617114.1 hypothetical protein XENTR_v10008984 [Xenopus tropicalis]
MTLQEILSNYHLPVAIQSYKALSFKEKGDVKSQDEILPELLLKDTYEENFLLGHPIDKKIYLLDKKNLSSQEPRYSTIEPIYIDIGELGIEQQITQKPSTSYEIQIPKVLKETNVYSGDEVPQLVPNVTTPIANISDIPKDLRGLTVKQVCDCLNLLNMNQYVEAFKAAQVDGQFLYELDHDMMTSCMGMNGLHVVKFMRFRDGWRPNMQDQ